jgi:acylphosphatase
MQVRRRVVVRGRVQGVGFRYATVDAALRHGVTGFVRNLPDGTVEAQVEGSPGAVEAMLVFLRSGPPGAAVVGTDVTPLPVRGGSGFDAAPTPDPHGWRAPPA